MPEKFMNILQDMFKKVNNFLVMIHNNLSSRDQVVMRNYYYYFFFYLKNPFCYRFTRYYRRIIIRFNNIFYIFSDLMGGVLTPLPPRLDYDPAPPEEICYVSFAYFFTKRKTL